MLVLGGGGYTLRNIPRCWTYETSILAGEPIKDELPFNDYFEYFGPDYRLHLPVSNMENLNSPEYLERTKIQLLEILREVEPVPGAQIQTGQIDSQVNPRSSLMMEEEDDDDEDDPDERHVREERKEHQSELAG
jgi:histone deacetylase 1/2